MLKLVDFSNINKKIEFTKQWIKTISYELNISINLLKNSLKKMKDLGIIYNTNKSIYVHSYIIYKTKHLLNNREDFCK